MKYLVATVQTQGQRDDDFCFVTEGELVGVGFTCGRDRRRNGTSNPHGTCGCGRSFTGVESHKGTTTAVVVDLAPEEVLPFPECNAFPMLLRTIPVGAIVERRGDHLQVRQATVERSA